MQGWRREKDPPLHRALLWLPGGRLVERSHSGAAATSCWTSGRAERGGAGGEAAPIWAVRLECFPAVPRSPLSRSHLPVCRHSRAAVTRSVSRCPVPLLHLRITDLVRTRTGSWVPTCTAPEFCLAGGPRPHGSCTRLSPY